MGRLTDFMNALVTDAAVARSFLAARAPRFGDNIARYYQECRERDLCLTHTLVDPQMDRSKGPAQQADPEAALHRVRETDRGLIVRGARMLSTLAPFSDEIWVGPFYPRRPGEEPYALCFAIPIDSPGLKFICREPYDAGRSRFDRPVSSRFDEEDALAVFDNVLVPWERVFINGDIEASNSFLLHGPGYALLQATVRGVVKLRFLAGLACHLGEAIGRTAAPHVQAQLGELVAKVELGNGLLRAAEVIRQLSGSGLILTPTERDFDNPEIAPYLEQYLQGKSVGARQRVQLFKLAWDLLGEQFGSRQLQYEWFYAGDPIFTRSRFYHSPAVNTYKAMVDRLLESEETTGGPLALR